MTEQTQATALPPRHPLPSRRLSETRKVETAEGTTVYLTIGYDPATPSQPREVFYSSGFRTGSQLEFQVQDITVLLSLMLQHGFTPAQLVKSLSTQEQPDRSMAFGSLTGLIAHELTLPPAWAEAAAVDA
jgi:hypothetical protein